MPPSELHSSSAPDVLEKYRRASSDSVGVGATGVIFAMEEDEESELEEEVTAGEAGASGWEAEAERSAMGAGRAGDSKEASLNEEEEAVTAVWEGAGAEAASEESAGSLGIPKMSSPPPPPK